MADIPDISSDEGSPDGAETLLDGQLLQQQQQQQQQQEQCPQTEQGGGSETNSSTTSSGSRVDDEPPATKEATADEQADYQLMPCKACTAHSSLAHCIKAKNRDGERHLPRLKFMRGNAFRRHCKALLLPGQREEPAEDPELPTKNYPMEELALTPDNLGLRFKVKCERCSTLANCTKNLHPAEVKSLADILQLPLSEDTPLLPPPPPPPSPPSPPPPPPQPRVVKVEHRQIVPRRQPSNSRRRVAEVEGTKIVMPNMISIYEGVVLSMTISQISITSMCCDGVPADFDLRHDMSKSAKGGFQFARMPGATKKSILVLRALRDRISWKHGPDAVIHPLVAAKVLNVWEKHHPVQAKQLTALLDEKGDKEIIFQVRDNGPSAIFTASELREVHARRFEKAITLIESLTEEEIYDTEPLVEAFAPSLTNGTAATSTRAGRRCVGPSSGSVAAADGSFAADGDNGGTSPNGGDDGSPVGRVYSSKRSFGAGSEAALGSAGEAAEDGAVEGETASAGAAATPEGGGKSAAKSRRGRRSRGGDENPTGRSRRKRVTEVVASNGKRYCLPSCIREKDSKLHLLISLRTCKVDGDHIFTADMPENSPLQKPFGQADITREDMLALRAVRDLMYRHPVVHPIVAAQAFEMWENHHNVTPPRADDDIVLVSGAATASGEVPEGSFVVGELRKLRGSERRAALEDVLDAQRRSGEVLAGTLEEAATPSAEAAAGGAPATPTPTKKGGRAAKRLAAGDGNGSGSEGSGSKKKKRRKAGVTVPESEEPSSSSSSSSSSLSPPPSGRKKKEKGNAKGSAVAAKKKNKKLEAKSAAAAAASDTDKASKQQRSAKKKKGVGRGAASAAAKRIKSEGGKGAQEEEGGSTEVSNAAARRARWLQAVHENDAHLKREQERIREEKAKAKDVHHARSAELMTWMVAEQSGKHSGSEGPPPIKQNK